MAKNSIRDYSATNSANTDIQSVDIDEGCSPAGINNALREIMVDLKNVSTGAVALESPAADSLTVTGATTIAGLTTSADITFGDNDKAIFGAGSDLQIYHDGSNSIVKDAGTGVLKIQGSGQVIIEDTAGNIGAVFNANTDVALKYAGSNKLVTTSGGIDVTGTAKSDVVQLDAGSAPTWDTNTRLWTESGFGARYDGYQHRFDVGVSRNEAMRIDASGIVLVGKSSTSLGTVGVAIRGGSVNGLIQATRNGGECIELNRTSSDGAIAVFTRQAVQVGNISVTGSSTAYNTSSDYRLKENVTYDWDATTRLKQLKPARFNFIADPDTTVDGFLAHECSAVPEAISGEKDAMRDEEYEVTPAVLDDDGNVVTEAVMGTRSVPDYQGIDQSKLVPLLVKTIQELEARITALEAE